MLDIIILIFTILLLSVLVFGLVSFFVHTDDESIKAIIRVRAKYGKIYNPVDAGWLFHRELYKNLPYNFSSTLIYFSPVLIGQFIWKETFKTLEEKLKEKYK